MSAPIPPHDPNVGQSIPQQPIPPQPSAQQPTPQQPNYQQPNYQQPVGGPATFGEIGKKYTDLAKANTTVNPKLVPFLWATAGAAFVVFISAFLPWVSVAGSSFSGTSGGRDGVFTLILGLIAGAVAVSAIFLAAKQQLLPRAAGIAAIVAGVLITLIAIIDILDVSDVQDRNFGLLIEVSVGFGLWLTLIAGLALLGLGIATLIVGKRA